MGYSAWIVETAGGRFQLTELPRPQLSPGQVLVRVYASGVNPLDTKIRAASAAHAKQPLPAVLGLDMAGVIEEIGPGVKGFRLGDEVYGMVGGVGGLQGTLAEYIVADATLLAPRPGNLTMRQAAALPLATITAWEGLVSHAHIDPLATTPASAPTVLIHGGAGGVGHIAVQIAVASGAKVFATVSPDKAHIVEGYGATPIDYRSLTVEQYVAEHTAGEGFDIIYDTVGGPTIDASFAAVKRYTGHVISCLGWSTHSLAPLSFRSATYSGVFTLYPLLSGDAAARAQQGRILAEATKLIEAGKLVPLLNEQSFNTGNIAAAHKLVESGALGKVVVEI
jgi:NADPH:quinone reductase-like Zn-dependent oxidoreductase